MTQVTKGRMERDPLNQELDDLRAENKRLRADWILIHNHLLAALKITTSALHDTAPEYVKATQG